MSPKFPNSGSVHVTGLIVATSILVAACGGGGSTTTTTTNPPVNPPANSTVTSTSTTPPPVNPTGFVGSCPSLGGGSSSPTGYEIGTCKTFFASGASVIAEATFQNQNVTSNEAPAALNYRLNLPSTAANPWGGTIDLASGLPNTKVFPTTGIGTLTVGYAIDRVVTATAPASDETSIVDFSGLLQTPTRYASYGLWGRSKLLNELFVGGFYGPTFGQSATPDSFTNPLTSTVTMTGNAVSHYIYSSNSAVPAGVSPNPSVSATIQMSVNFSSLDVTGTIDNVSIRSGTGATVAVTSVGAAPITFTAKLVKATGAFSGTITGGGTGLVKGSLFGPSAQQAAGQFVVSASGNRLFTGAFGVKQ
jgi:hypothetical protein